MIKNKILKKENFRQNYFGGTTFSDFSKGQKSTSIFKNTSNKKDAQ
jgi:hypothetical protein